MELNGYHLILQNFLIVYHPISSIVYQVAGWGPRVNFLQFPLVHNACQVLLFLPSILDNFAPPFLSPKTHALTCPQSCPMPAHPQWFPSSFVMAIASFSSNSVGRFRGRLGHCSTGGRDFCVWILEFKHWIFSFSHCEKQRELLRLERVARPQN